jgi:hypothetical protein
MAVLPAARGPLTRALFGALTRAPHDLDNLPLPYDDEDASLALYVMYEQHYRGFDDVDESWEWEPSLLRERARLEGGFGARVRETVGRVNISPSEVTDELLAIAHRDGRSLSRHVMDCGTLADVREFAIHRSAYQLKEADPHTFAIPRLAGRAKAALVTIQADEYGDGDATRSHATLYAGTMRALGLDDSYGAYLDRIPAVTLDTVNLMSFFGLHRRWRGALVGHLALFEMCSVTPMRRYATTLRRLGVADAARFYDVHVEADEYHEVVALHDMARELACQEPRLASDIVFGARALDAFESAFAHHLTAAWTAGKSSLRPCSN